ncbi:MAG: ABC transporter permease [Deltaproteobacteria bacterium]|nr:ABC transporter permease [Deltaproteobacteria bacterium]
MKKINLRTIIGSGILAMFILIGLCAPWITSYDPKATMLEERFSPPSHIHWLGQDKLGSDIWSKIIYGARISLVVSCLSTLFALIIGLCLGSAAGYFGSWVEELIMRCVDILLAFPGLLLIFALAAFLKPSLINLILIFSLVGWTGFARVARSQVLVEKEKDFVLAAHSLGAGHFYILIRHIWPNILAPLMIQASFFMGGVIIGESSLSFLGVGVPPDAPSWGNMLNLAKQSAFQPGFVAIFPGLAIMLIVLGFNFIGDGLRDLLDPKMKHSQKMI